MNFLVFYEGAFAMFSERYSTTMKIKNFKRVILMVLCDIFIVIASAWMADALRSGTHHLDIFDFYEKKYNCLNFSFNCNVIASSFDCDFSTW